MNPSRPRVIDVAAAELRLELEVLADRHALGADVAVPLASLAVDAAVGPDEFQIRRDAGRFETRDQPLARGLRQYRQVHDAAAEQRVADLVDHRARPVARDDVPGVVEPGRAARRAHTHPEVAAAARQVERELRAVARIDAERRVAAVQRPVEELRAVLDDEVRLVRPVAQRPLDVLVEVRADARAVAGGSGACQRHARRRQGRLPGRPVVSD